MHAYFFGDSDKQLYGVYEPPRSSTPSDSAVLLCYPAGQEYMRSHWAFRQLTNQLCRAGYHCMRFDYFGSGDSAGTGIDASLQQWQADVSAGLVELRDNSGATKLSIAGCRFGATLASITPVNETKIERLILWDPVISGKSYISELRDMNQALLSRLKALHKNRPCMQMQGAEEILGYRYSDTFISEISSVNLLETESFNANEICLYVSGAREEYEQLREHLQNLGILADFKVIASSGEWDNLIEIENALIASEIISAITGYIRQ